MESKKRGARASETQKEYLINFLEERPDLANDKFTTVDGAHCRQNEWDNLSERLNSLGGAIKDGYKWRKYWKDLTIGVRAKDSAIKEQREKSDVNGPIPIKDLSDTDKRIIGIITPEAVEGVSASVAEIGFGVIVSQVLNCDEEEKETLSSQSVNMPSASRLKTKLKKRTTISDSTDNALQVYKEIEEKKMKLEQQKIELMRENNILQGEIKQKLNELLEKWNKD